MKFSSVLDLRYPMLFILATFTDLVTTLKDVTLVVPSAIEKGGIAKLFCDYNLDGDELYSVKWYKGKREFYRYTPKENPALKTFPVSGIYVERSMSNESHLTLTSVEPTISGKYSCEVSADAPTFHTMLVASEMEVIEPPERGPSITGIKSEYKIVCVGKIYDIYKKATEKYIDEITTTLSSSSSAIASATLNEILSSSTSPVGFKINFMQSQYDQTSSESNDVVQNESSSPFLNSIKANFKNLLNWISNKSASKSFANREQGMSVCCLLISLMHCSLTFVWLVNWRWDR